MVLNTLYLALWITVLISLIIFANPFPSTPFFLGWYTSWFFNQVFLFSFMHFSRILFLINLCRKKPEKSRRKRKIFGWVGVFSGFDKDKNELKLTIILLHF